MISLYRNEASHPLSNAPSSTKDYTARKAGEYARWLAQRDGVAIPHDAECVAHWGSVDVPGKAKPEPRVFAVTFHAYRSHSHRNHSGLGEELARIAIPHWDWVPQVQVDDAPMSTDIKSAQWIADFIAA